MDGEMFLNADEVSQLTGRQKPACQTKALKLMGIECKINAAGMVIVLRSHVEMILSGGVSARAKRKIEPQFENAR